MNAFITNNGLRPGDVIIGPKSNFNIVQHYVVYLGVDEWGNDLYAENKIGHGVRIIYHKQFTAENPTCTRIQRFIGNDYQRNEAIQRALSLVGRSYDMTTFNCEHFANYVQSHQVKSKQVDTGLALAGIAALFLIVGAIASSK